MGTPAILDIYRDLADAYEQREEPSMRDRFLVLAADAAYSADQPEEAERLRQRLLDGSPHHMLKPYSSFGQALEASAVQIYLQDLRINYPAEMAEQLLQSLRDELQEPVVQETEIPTTPFLDAEGRPTVPLGTEPDPLEFFGLQDEPPEPPRRVVPLRPTEMERPRRQRPAAAAPPPPAAVPAPPPVAPPPPTPPPRPAPPRPKPAPPQYLPPTLAPVDPFVPQAPSEPELPAGAWLTLLLFGMTVTAGIALAAYTLARPFLPREWVP